MAMVRYSPWNAEGLQSEINRLFNHWTGDNESSAATAGWVPAADVYEYTDRFELFVDLPGVAPQQVEITLDKGVMSISGERRARAQEEGEQPWVGRRSERGSGHFHRRFTLPDTADSERVEARHREGVLEITIPKQERAQPRRIEVAA